MLQLFEGLAKPLDEQAPLWRFMDFTKYVAMLHRQALFFARADEMPDPFEGLSGRRRRQSYERRPDLKRLRQRIMLSCWHENEHESAAMWRIYLSAEDGVAIRSSFARLRDSLSAATNTIVIGRVQYVDRHQALQSHDNELAPFFCKRKHFEYEREVRALCQEDHSPEELGRYVPVDLRTLIEQVVIAPSGQAWLRDLVSSVTKRYGFDVPVVASTMLDPPDDDGCKEVSSGSREG